MKSSWRAVVISGSALPAAAGNGGTVGSKLQAVTGAPCVAWSIRGTEQRFPSWPRARPGLIGRRANHSQPIPAVEAEHVWSHHLDPTRVEWPLPRPTCTVVIARVRIETLVLRVIRFGSPDATALVSGGEAGEAEEKAGYAHGGRLPSRPAKNWRMIRASRESITPFSSTSAASTQDSDWRRSARYWRISNGSVESSTSLQLTSPRSGVGAGVGVVVTVGIAVGVVVAAGVVVDVGAAVGALVAVAVGPFVGVTVSVLVGVGVGIGAKTVVVSITLLFVSSASFTTSNGSTVAVFSTEVSTSVETAPVIVTVPTAAGPVPNAPRSQSTVPPDGEPS